MKVVLSRKGFDSSAGGCPSPVFPDGTFLALPIQDEHSPIRYRDLCFQGMNVGDLVAELTGRPERAEHGAHLDPDLNPDLLSRKPGWRPSLGQMGQPQSHLRNEGVQEGDLFLFFGLFRRVECVEGRWRLDRDYCRLECVPRGQEFVLDTRYYPEALSWAEALLRMERR